MAKGQRCVKAKNCVWYAPLSGWHAAKPVKGKNANWENQASPAERNQIQQEPQYNGMGENAAGRKQWRENEGQRAKPERWGRTKTG